VEDAVLTSSSETVAPFVPIGTKLSAPHIRAGTVLKSEVIGRLQASEAPLVTLVAPAGYGKTTLLARWADVDPRPFAWVALDGREDDDLMFLRYIATALHRVEPLAPEVFGALSVPGAIWSTGLPRLGAALAGLRAAGPARGVVPLPPPVRPAAAQRAAAERP
jgi:LuxR family maltose regulon positive regulatory protein